MKPALIIGSFTMGLGVIRSLGKMGVPIVVFYYDEHDMGYVSRYVKEVITIPHPAHQEEAFVAALLAHADRFAGGVLFPTSDAALAAVARHKPQLAAHFQVAAVDWPVAQQFIEKKVTYALADTIGVPAPKTLTPTCFEEVERYSEQVTYPCLVKPSQSHLFYAHFHTKAIQADTQAELLAAYRAAVQAGLDVVLQEFIPGGDACGAIYNAYFEDGQPLVEFTARKVRSAPPDFGSPCVNVSELIPEVVGPGRAILGAMHFDGYACIEFKQDERDGIYRVIDINGRHNLSTMLAVRCGINFPWLHYQHLAEGVAPHAMDFMAGIYWIDILRDVSYSLPGLRSGRYRLGDLIKPYRRAHVFAILDVCDLAPFLKRIGDLVRAQVLDRLPRVKRPTVRVSLAKGKG